MDKYNIDDFLSTFESNQLNPNSVYYDQINNQINNQLNNNQMDNQINNQLINQLNNQINTNFNNQINGNLNNQINNNFNNKINGNFNNQINNNLNEEQIQNLIINNSLNCVNFDLQNNLQYQQQNQTQLNYNQQPNFNNTSFNNYNLDNCNISPILEASNDELIDRINDMQIRCLNSYNNLPKSVRDNLKIINSSQNNYDQCNRRSLQNSYQPQFQNNNKINYMNQNVDYSKSRRNNNLNIQKNSRPQQIQQPQHSLKLYSNQPTNNLNKANHSTNFNLNSYNLNDSKNCNQIWTRNQQNNNNYIPNYNNHSNMTKTSNLLNQNQQLKLNNLTNDKLKQIKLNRIEESKIIVQMIDITKLINDNISQLDKLRDERLNSLYASKDECKFKDKFEIKNSKPTIDDLFNFILEEYEEINKWFLKNKEFFEKTNESIQTTISTIQLWVNHVHVIKYYYERNIIKLNVNKIDNRTFFNSCKESLSANNVDLIFYSQLKLLIKYTKEVRTAVWCISRIYLNDDKQLTTVNIDQYYSKL